MAEKEVATLSVDRQRSHLNVLIDESFRKIIDDQYRWKCNQCDKSYTTKFNLVTHVMDHKGIKPHLCNECGKAFKQQGHLTTHMMIHTGVKRYTCNICTKQFRQLTHLKKHELTHRTHVPRGHMMRRNSSEFIKLNNIPGSSFSLDNPTFKEQNFRQTSYSSVLEPLENSSEKAGSADEDNTSQQDGEGAHNQSEESSSGSTAGTNLHVPLCSVADVLAATTVTMETVHELGHQSQIFLPNQFPTSFSRSTNTSPRVCHLCGKCFAYPSQLKEHIDRHNDVRPFVCSECGMQFRKEHHLRQHAFTHSGMKPFICEECGQGFSMKANLQRHEAKHSSNRDFKCEVCKKTFVYKQTLSAHMVTHEKNKPFKCETCGKEFTRKVNLVHHVYLHYGTKPFKCRYCTSRFNHKGNMKRHMKDKHPHEDQNDETEVENTMCDNYKRELDGEENSEDEPLAEENQQVKRAPQRMLKNLKEINPSSLEGTYRKEAITSILPPPSLLEYSGMNFEPINDDDPSLPHLPSPLARHKGGSYDVDSCSNHSDTPFDVPGSSTESNHDLQESPLGSDMHFKVEQGAIEELHVNNILS